MREIGCDLSPFFSFLHQTTVIALTSRPGKLMTGKKAKKRLRRGHELVHKDLRLLNCIWSSMEGKEGDRRLQRVIQD